MGSLIFSFHFQRIRRSHGFNCDLLNLSILLSNTVSVGELHLGALVCLNHSNHSVYLSCASVCCFLASVLLNSG